MAGAAEGGLLDEEAAVGQTRARGLQDEVAAGFEEGGAAVGKDDGAIGNGEGAVVEAPGAALDFDGVVVGEVEVGPFGDDGVVGGALVEEASAVDEGGDDVCVGGEVGVVLQLPGAVVEDLGRAVLGADLSGLDDGAVVDEAGILVEQEVVAVAVADAEQAVVGQAAGQGGVGRKGYLPVEL